MDHISRARSCRSCGARLASANRAAICGPCEVTARERDVAAPAVPAEFWLADEMLDALGSRHMGRVVAAFRRHPYHQRPISQEVAGRWFHITQGQLSRLEHGPPIKDLDRLVLWARVLRIPAHLLWFKLPDGDPGVTRGEAAGPGPIGGPRSGAPLASTAGAGRLPVGRPGGVVLPDVDAENGPGLAHSLISTLESYAAIDNLVGPKPLLALVPRHISFIEERLLSSSGPGQVELLYAAARFAELAGWLHQDAGDLAAALRWSNVALEFARGAGDDDLASYIWMRKSNIGSDTGRPHLAVVFAQAALEGSSALAPRLRAVALRQQAHAHALAGEPDACARALDQAYEHAANADDDAEIARYCTPGYVEMEAAHCWIELGRPERAMATLKQALADWDPGFRRDLGLCLARLAVAHASGGDPDSAVAAAERAMAIAVDTRSQRTSYQLSRIPGLLDASGARDAAEQTRHMLTVLR